MNVESLTAEHDALRTHVDHIRLAAREVPDLSPEERAQLVGRVLDFLRGTLLPHAAHEESGLYVEVATVLGHAESTAPMVFDHRAIVERIDWLTAADVKDGDRLQELLYGLYALIDVHFRKEEELYLPLVDAERVLVHEP